MWSLAAPLRSTGWLRTVCLLRTKTKDERCFAQLWGWPGILSSLLLKPNHRVRRIKSTKKLKIRQSRTARTPPRSGGGGGGGNNGQRHGFKVTRWLVVKVKRRGVIRTTSFFCVCRNHLWWWVCVNGRVCERTKLPLQCHYLRNEHTVSH